MKKILLSLVVVCCLGFSSAIAASSSLFSFRIKADIPFDFQIGKKKMPKGDYIIESVNDSGTVLIRKEKGGKAVNIMTIKDKHTDKHKSKLMFRRYGDQYFLARIWDGSSESVLKIEKSSAEKKVAKLFKDKSGKDEDEVPVSDK
ncbi:MAG TPA: hypothetical protein PLK30_26505 [Blastocatellia bacterium]|nr:hypothetical protein [Blastocatellia bacterium]